MYVFFRSFLFLPSRIGTFASTSFPKGQIHVRQSLCLNMLIDFLESVFLNNKLIECLKEVIDISLKHAHVIIIFERYIHGPLNRVLKLLKLLRFYGKCLLVLIKKFLNFIFQLSVSGLY